MKIPWLALMYLGLAVTSQRLVEAGREPPEGWVLAADVDVWYDPKMEIREA